MLGPGQVAEVKEPWWFVWLILAALCLNAWMMISIKRDARVEHRVADMNGAKIKVVRLK